MKFADWDSQTQTRTFIYGQLILSALVRYSLSFPKSANIIPIKLNTSSLKVSKIATPKQIEESVYIIHNTQRA